LVAKLVTRSQISSQSAYGV